MAVSVTTLDMIRAEYQQAVTDGSRVGHFSYRVRSVDWRTRPPSELIEVIRMALNLTAPLLARKLATLGHELYPDNEELQKAAHVLAPPRVISANDPPIKGLSASMRWISQNAHSYRGQWIAVKEGQLIAVGELRHEVIERLHDSSAESGTIVTRIP